MIQQYRIVLSLLAFHDLDLPQRGQSVGIVMVTKG